MKKFFVAVILSLICFVSNAQPKHIYQLSLDNVKVEVGMSSANSVGGRKFETQIINCSEKTIKYIWITEAAVDNFCNFAPCEISKELMKTTRIIGPIEGNPKLLNKKNIPHKFMHNYHSNDLHYRYSATKSIIAKCKIEFVDGSVVEYINKDLLNYLTKQHYDIMKTKIGLECSMEDVNEYIIKRYFNMF